MDEELEDVFNIFAGFGNRSGPLLLDGPKFSKLCRDCDVQDRVVTPSVIDIIFLKSKPVGERRMDFTHWLLALNMLAAEKYPGDPDGPQRIRELIVRNQGPTATATVAATDGIYAKLTDSRLYTGSHRHRFDESGHGRGSGGRDASGTTTHQYHGGGEVVSDLSLITRDGMRGGTLLSSASAARREAASGATSPAKSPKKSDSVVRSARSPARGLSAASHGSPHMSDEYGSPQRRPPSSPSLSAAAVLATSQIVADESALFNMYMTFCVFGNTSGSVEEMDNSHFAKLCKESGIQGKRVPAASVDIVFNKVKTIGRRTINFDQFKAALLLLSRERFPADDPDASMQAIVSMVVNCGGPIVTTATPPTASVGSIFDRLTDTRLYTGAHKFRFDESGRGLGIDGREDVHELSTGRIRGNRVTDLSQITRTNLGTVGV